MLPSATAAPAWPCLPAGSRPSSRATNSRPGSRADAAPGARGSGALAAVPEEAAAVAGRLATAAPGAAGAAVVEPEQPAGMPQQASGLHDADGFLIDSSVDASLEQEVGRC